MESMDNPGDARLSGNCDIDVNECDSSPCQNGATCAESTTDASISLHTYQCTCVAGFANGVCDYLYISEYSTECNVQESSNLDGAYDDRDQTPRLAGNCDIDVDECASMPCQNGATCTESTVESAVSFHTYQCTCAAGFANGVCEYIAGIESGGIAEYAAECSVMESDDANGTIVYHIDGLPRLAGNCDIDVVECDSSPCQNGALCTDSTSEPAVSIHAYQCTCEPGFANGVCEYDFISEFALQCAVMESDDNPDNATLSGNCDIDVDECDSSPCQNGATCTESTVETSVSFHAYQCTCVAGFANGVCEYNFISEYTTECTVTESSSSLSLAGNCDIDVNECDSSPCANGAACTESAVVNGYSVLCVGGVCTSGIPGESCVADANTYIAARCAETAAGTNSVPADDALCTAVVDRDDSTECDAVMGTVDTSAAVCTYTAAEAAIDCSFTPLESASCPAGCTYTPPTVLDGFTAVTLEATTDINTYRCLCEPGFANGMCDYAFIAEYATQCNVL
jgi:protein crumbs